MRTPQLGIVVGKKGVGKTYKTLQIISEYVKGNMIKKIKPKRVLILDVNGEFTDVKPISVIDVKRWCDVGKIEVRRVCIFKTKEEGGGTMTLDEIADTLNEILKSFHGGLLLIEDITRFVSDSPKRDLIGAIMTQRHKNCDIIIHFQTIGKAGHPKIFAGTNWIRFHMVSDTVERHKNKFNEFTTPMKILEALVRNQFESGDIRFHAYFSMDNYKIIGDFNKVQFINACKRYIEENYSETVKREMNKINLNTGKSMYSNQKDAVIHLLTDLFNKYYGL